MFQPEIEEEDQTADVLRSPIMGFDSSAERQPRLEANIISS